MCNTSHKRNHVSPLLRSLHWLTIKTCIKDKLSTLCHFFTLIQPLFICLTFFLSYLHRDSSSPLIQELYAFCTWRPKHLDIALFPRLLLLSGIVCLLKLDACSQPLHLKLPWRLIFSNLSYASEISTPSTFFCKLLQLTWCVCVCVCVYVCVCVTVCVCVCVWCRLCLLGSLSLD